MECVDEGGWPQQPKAFFLKIALLANATVGQTLKFTEKRGRTVNVLKERLTIFFPYSKQTTQNQTARRSFFKDIRLIKEQKNKELFRFFF